MCVHNLKFLCSEAFGFKPDGPVLCDFPSFVLYFATITYAEQKSKILCFSYLQKKLTERHFFTPEKRSGILVDPGDDQFVVQTTVSRHLTVILNLPVY
jgi:hypothetical protein